MAGLSARTPAPAGAQERFSYTGWKQSGYVTSGVRPWAFVTGKAKDAAEIGRLYRHPADRNFRRDDTEGRLGFGSSQPDGLVYFPGVLALYLRHRPASRLLAPPRADQPLGQLLAGARGARK